MWYALAALGWVLLRRYQGKPILPEWPFHAFKNGAALVAAPTANGHVIVAVPADTPLLSPGDPNGAPVLAQTPQGVVQITIPQTTVIAAPSSLAASAFAPATDTSIHAPRYLSGDILVCERRSLSSSDNPAAPPGTGGAGGGDAGRLAAAMGSFEVFDPNNGAGPNYEYPDDLDVPRSTSLSRVQFRAR